MIPNQNFEIYSIILYYDSYSLTDSYNSCAMTDTWNKWLKAYREEKFKEWNVKLSVWWKLAHDEGYGQNTSCCQHTGLESPSAAAVSLLGPHTQCMANNTTHNARAREKCWQLQQYYPHPWWTTTQLGANTKAKQNIPSGTSTKSPTKQLGIQWFKRYREWKRYISFCRNFPNTFGR